MHMMTWHILGFKTLEVLQVFLHGGEFAHGDGPLAHATGDAVDGRWAGHVPEGLLLQQRILGLRTAPSGCLVGPPLPAAMAAAAIVDVRCNYKGF